MPNRWHFDRDRGQWWFRVYGYGIHWKRLSQHPLVFSEREGLRKIWIIGNWCVSPLKPNDWKTSPK